MLEEARIRTRSSNLDDLRAYIVARRELNELGTPADWRAIREAAGVSRRHLASAVGVSHTAVEHWETGGHGIRRRYIHDYLAALRMLKDEAADGGGRVSHNAEE